MSGSGATGASARRLASSPAIVVAAVVIFVLAAGCRREGGSQVPSPEKTATDAKNVQAPPGGPPVPKPLEAKVAKVPGVPPIERDLPQIAAGKTLKVLFTFNSTGYFVYRGETMGFEYDLLELFARQNGLKLRPVVVRDAKAVFDRLNRGEGDIVAAQLAAASTEQSVLMTQPLYSTTPVVVQRTQTPPAGWKSPTGLYAVAYRPVTVRHDPRLEMWPEALALGKPLPVMPLWLANDLCVPLWLEDSYTATCRSLRISAA